MKKLLVLVLCMIALFTSGCASYYSLSCSQDEIAKERIIASGNKDAIGAVNQGVPAAQALKVIPIQGGAILAIDLLDWEVFIKHPIRQLLAAGADFGTGYGLYSLATQKNKDKPSVQISVNGNGNTTTSNTGNNNSNMGNPDYSTDNSISY
jgi:hypothetical protein